MICLERENSRRDYLNKMPAVPSNFREIFVPFVNRLWSPLVSNANHDRAATVNYLLTEENSLCGENICALRDICDFVSFSEAVDNRTAKNRYNLLRALEFDAVRLFGASYLEKVEESCLCPPLFKKLSFSKNTAFTRMSSYFNSPTKHLLLDNISLCDMMTSLKVSIPAELSKCSTFPMLPTAADKPAHNMDNQNVVDDQNNIEVALPCALNSNVTMQTPPVVGNLNQHQKGKRVSNMEVMNNQLIHRKSQKMNKNAKKRRRRQKKQKPKVQQNSSNGMDAVNFGKESTTPSAEDAKQIKSPLSDKAMHDIKISIQCLQTSPDQTTPSSISFFFEHVIDSGTDEEWDCDEGVGSVENSIDDFEFPSLMMGLSSIHISGTASISIDCTSASSNTSPESCHISVIEFELSAELKEVNDVWEKTMFDVCSKEKVPEKVSFAKEEDLVKEYPVDNYDRKGEWERYALERFRFQKRIKETEPVLAPCLTKTHREKIQKRQNCCYDMLESEMDSAFED